MFVPPRPRVLIEDRGYELHIEIPPRRDAASVAQWAFLTFWLCGWAAGETVVGAIALTSLLAILGRAEVIGAPAQQSPGPTGFALAFLLFWLCGWTVGGLMAIRHWLHLMWGRETIVVDSTRLGVIARPLQPVREYSAPEVRGLRVSRDALQQSPQWRSPQRARGGSISFTYGGQEYSFGATLDLSEAEMVINEIGRRYKWMVEPPA